MSVIFKTIINRGKTRIFRKLLNTTTAPCKCVYVRNSTDVSKKFKTFDEIVTQRREEARRSIVVQVNSEASYNELFGYCSKYAMVNGIHHYRNSGGDHFMLIEFSSEDNMKELVKACGTHQKDLDVMALDTPFLWFRAATGKKEKFLKPNGDLLSVNGVSAIDEDRLFQELTECQTVSDQIQLLYDRTTLNDLGTRLRYMVARQLECVFKSLYTNIAVRPFGSSINGFGRMGCDLDLVLTNVLPSEMQTVIPEAQAQSKKDAGKKSKQHLMINSDDNYFTDKSSSQRRLVYQDKKCEGGRSPWQRHMECVSELLELRVPGAARVQRILNARVPIVKFAHDYTDLDCDLCYNNMSGVYMSELLWLFGTLDPRVRPLTFAVRRWAKAAGLTSPHPGRWITNFPLTLMVLFFLQQKTNEGCVLPSVKTLVKFADKEDVRIAEENLNCTFLRDMNHLPRECYAQHPANLETLLLQFFEFYSQFDFQDKAISINEGVSVRKPNSLPLYIVNPLEQALNVSRNVSYEECERLRLEVRNAAWQLESLDGQKGEDWGIIGIIEKKSTRGLKKLLRVGNSHRLISVKDLFNDTDENVQEDTLKNKLDRLTHKSEKEIEKNVKELKDSFNKDVKKDQRLKFKNSQVASAVYRIQRDKVV